VNSIEEIGALSEKVDVLMKLVASKNTRVDPNEFPLSTLIEKNNDPVGVNFASQNNFNNNAYRGNFNPRPFPGNSSNNYNNFYGNSYSNNRMNSDLENNIKDFINTRKAFNSMVEENLSKLDDMSRSVDRIVHDVENLKSKVLPPRVDINESIKALHVSMDESKKITAMLRAKRYFLEKALRPRFYHSNDEDVKMIGVSSIDSLFSRIKLDDKGTEEEPTLASGSPHSLEGENLDENLVESGLEEVKT
jgi:hypothetical protein